LPNLIEEIYEFLHRIAILVIKFCLFFQDLSTDFKSTPQNLSNDDDVFVGRSTLNIDHSDGFNRRESLSSQVGGSQARVWNAAVPESLGFSS